MPVPHRLRAHKAKPPYRVAGSPEDERARTLMPEVHSISAGGFGGEVCGLPVARLDEISPSPDRLFIVAVGNPSARKRLATRAVERGCQLLTLVHPLAYVAPSAELGSGRLVSPFVFVGPSARIGEHVGPNVHAIADHDVTIGPFGYLAPYACVSGGATLGEAVALPAHCSVAPGVTVEPGTRLPPGAHVPGR